MRLGILWTTLAVLICASTQAQEIKTNSPFYWSINPTDGALYYNGGKFAVGGTDVVDPDVANQFFGPMYVDVPNPINANAISAGAGQLTVNARTSTTTTGNNISILGLMQVHNQPSATGGTFVGGWFFSFCDTGVGGTVGTPAGACVATNPQVKLTSNATNWVAANGGEVDVEVDTGITVKGKIGWQVTTIGTDRVQGTTLDTAYLVGSVPGSPGWHNGLAFSNWNGAFPIDSTGTLISVLFGGTVAFGLDFSLLSYSSGGAPIVAALTTPASSSTACKAGSIEWDASFFYVCTATNTWKRAALATF